MHSENHRYDASQDEWVADARTAKPLTSERVFVARKREFSGSRKTANRARYRRGGKAAFFNGAHRRRSKRIDRQR